MNYDFDKIVNRQATDSTKWDDIADADMLPLWVADMDFEVAPAIQDAIKKRAAHPVFGYTHIPESYYDSIVGWFSRRHKWHIDKQWIIPTTGVIPAMSAVIKAVCMPGENVLVATPVYNHFFSSIRNNGCVATESRLLWRGGRYEMDWDDFERRASDPKTTLFLLCNPHNPAGRVWTEDELLRMADICMRHNVAVCSDEIHCELTRPGLDYVPFARLPKEKTGELWAVMNSPSKSFNIAGLQAANIVCAHPELRRRIDRAININEVCDLNPFGVVALQAAYDHSEDWLDQLRSYIWANYEALRHFFADRLPHITVAELEGTYLAWADIRATGMTSSEAERRLMEQAHVRVSPGSIYSLRDGEGFIRINMACPRAMLMEALGRMEKVLKI